MIRNVLASSALIALLTLGGLGLAQGQDDRPSEPKKPGAVQPLPAANAQEQPDPGIGASETKPTLQPEQPTLATAFIGRSVYSSQNPEADNLGNINDLIVSKDGTITHAVVGVGGFLGVGEKNVPVAFDELQVVERDGGIRLIYAATRADLEAAKNFDRSAYEPSARGEPQQ